MKKQFKLIVALFLCITLLVPTTTLFAATPTRTTEDFVRTTLTSIYTTPPSAATVNTWTKRLQGGTYTASTMISTILLSSTYTKYVNNKYFDPKYRDYDFISAMYKTAVGRTPKQTELFNGLSQLSSGKTKQYILKKLLDTASSKNYHKKFDVSHGYITERKYTALELFVDRTYYTFMGKPATLSYVTATATKLLTKKLSAVAFIYGLTTNKTYKNKKVDNATYITNIYYAPFKKKPTVSISNSYIKLLEAGYSRKYVLNKLATSSSFKSTAKSLKITSGTLPTTAADKPNPTDPTNPTNPTNPTDPTQPTSPTNPTNPTTAPTQPTPAPTTKPAPALPTSTPGKGYEALVEKIIANAISKGGTYRPDLYGTGSYTKENAGYSEGGYDFSEFAMIQGSGNALSVLPLFTAVWIIDTGTSVRVYHIG